MNMNNNEKYAIGVDIGGTHIRIGAISQDYRLDYFRKVKTADVLLPGQTIPSLIDFLKQYIDDTIGRGYVTGVGIGFPSIVSKDKKRLLSTPNLDDLDDVNIVDPLEEYFGIPVHIDNDVNFLLQYEIIKREVAVDHIVLGFYVGTGFGNSIYMNNHFLTGKNGAAGELGHIPVLGSNVICQCGNEGCIEMYASGKFLVDLHSRYFGDVAFEEIFTHYGTHEKVESYIQSLSIPIATEVNILDPDLIILGGGVIGMNDFPKSKLEEEIMRYCRKPYPARGLKIEYAEDTNSAGVVGAASLVFEKVRKVNKVV